LCWNGGSKTLSVINCKIGIKILWIIWEFGSTWIKFIPYPRRVDEEVAKSKGVKAITTSRSRQAHFIRFMNRVNQDPCTMSSAQKSLIVSYCRICIEGKNIRHKDSIRAADTVAGYMKEVNVLFKKRNLPLPIDFKDRKDKVSILISNLKAEEDIANQRSPLSPQMVAEFIRKGKAADHLSFKALGTTGL
jgi:hypothetical protein